MATIASKSRYYARIESRLDFDQFDGFQAFFQAKVNAGEFPLHWFRALTPATAPGSTGKIQWNCSNVTDINAIVASITLLENAYAVP